MLYSCDGQESEEPWGKRVTECQNSPGTPRANSSHQQLNCCELQVASRNRLSRRGFKTRGLFFIILTHNGPLRSNLQIQVCQSSFFSFRSYIDSLSSINSPISAGMCELSLRLILRNTMVPIWSFSKVYAIPGEILWSCSLQALIEFQWF